MDVCTRKYVFYVCNVLWNMKFEFVVEEDCFIYFYHYMYLFSFCVCIGFILWGSFVWKSKKIELEKESMLWSK